MTSQRSPHGRFTRASKQRNLFQAEVAARELRGLSLVDALEFVVLIGTERPDRRKRSRLAWQACG
jgi:hypothetical protein